MVDRVMVLAAAGPLASVARTFPIGIAAGNGASFPATYVAVTVITDEEIHRLAAAIRDAVGQLRADGTFADV